MAVIVTSVLFVFAVIFLYFKWTYGYWKRQNVSYISPSIPFGNLENPLWMKRGFVGILEDAHNELKTRGKRFGGIFILHKPILVLVDPQIIKLALAKDFVHFMNHGNFVDEKKEPLSANLLNLEDDRWKNLRTKVSPTFTSGKMKMMYEEMLICAHQMVKHIHYLTSKQQPLDIKEIIACYSTDIIGSCAFGLNCNSFTNPNAEFRKYGRMLMDMDIATTLKMFIIFLIPEVNKLYHIKLVKKEIEKFFTNAFTAVINHRISTGVKRNDFVQILLELGDSDRNGKNLTMQEMLAQSFIFFGAGFETSAINLTFCLYELAIHQEYQDKLRNEILEVLKRHDGKLTYEAVMEMQYMDQVLDETLRKYPPIPFLNRRCNKDYKIPGANFIIRKGTSVFVSVRGLHMDPENFPEPKKFCPDRFSKENKPKIRPCTFLPFGDGPRICIGQRFAILQNKIGLALILKNFKILLCENTPKIIRVNPRGLTTTSLDTLLLKSKTL